MCSPTENSNYNFKEIAPKIFINYKNHEVNFKQSCVQKSVIALSDFFEGYEREIKEIDSALNQEKYEATVNDYAELFKAFDDHPTILQKPKRSAPPKEKLNSSLWSGSSTGNLLVSQYTKEEETSPITAHEVNKTKVWPKASETYNDFKSFQQKLKILETELKDKQLAADYANKLNQLDVFSRQMEKLLPAERIAKPGFTAKEEQNLQKLTNDLEKLIFLQENERLFQDAIENDSHDMDYVESLIDVLTYAINAIKG